jgi:hypothetical protein
MATQTTTTTLGTPQVQHTPPVGVPENGTHQEPLENDASKDDIKSSPSELLPNPNTKLSGEELVEKQFNVTYYADEDEKIFDQAFLNEDDLLLKYWTILKDILETPCDDRVASYQSRYIVLPCSQKTDQDVTQI